MPYIEADEIMAARQIDLLTYLQQYEPNELVKLDGGNYCTREHDSLKISNGKWHWFSRGIGGRTALDYLVKVKGMSFPDAVHQLTGGVFKNYTPPKQPPAPKERNLLLPEDQTSTIDILLGIKVGNHLLSMYASISAACAYDGSIFAQECRQGLGQCLLHRLSIGLYLPTMIGSAVI